MKATIKFDFARMFLYKDEIREEESEDVIEVDYDCLDEFNIGDEVEILKIVESKEFSGGKGYVIYNPKNNASTVVAYHVLNFTNLKGE